MIENVRSPDPLDTLDARWVTLQRAVAVCMIVILAIPMVVFLERFVPPLGVASILFGLAFALTWIRPRIGAIGIGVLSALWLLTQVANYPRVIPDLTRPSETPFFFITIGMLVFSIAGVVGLIGVLRTSPGHIAVRTLQIAGIILVGSLLLSVLMNL